MTRLKTIIGMLAVSFALSGAASATIITDDPSLPPTVGSYFSKEGPVEYAGPDLALINIIHFGFIIIILNTIVADVFELFDSTVTGFAGPIGGPFNQPVTLSGLVRIQVFGKAGNTTGTFQTEMLQLDLSGAGIMVRESPTLASLGQTTISDIGGGVFKIDSFFDVFSELSLDFGSTWFQSTGSHRVELVPEPASLALLALGLGALGVVRVRVRSRSMNMGGAVRA